MFLIFKIDSYANFRFNLKSRLQGQTGFLWKIFFFLFRISFLKNWKNLFTSIFAIILVVFEIWSVLFSKLVELGQNFLRRISYLGKNYEYLISFNFAIISNGNNRKCFISKIHFDLNLLWIDWSITDWRIL